MGKRIRWWTFGFLVAGFLALAAGCDHDVSAELACKNVCECYYFFPSEQRQCEAECKPQLSGQPPDCITCLANTECRELEDLCSLECPVMNSLPGENDEAR